MASLGMPERMTYDFSEYRGKRGIMLADIQTFLHGVALKLGVVIYMGAVARRISAAVLQSGEIELQRATHGATEASVGMVRWQHDTIARVRSGAIIRFDTLVEATGGRSGLRETLVGQDNVVLLRTLGRTAVAQDPTLDSFFADPEDYTADYVESDYGCPPGLREAFAAAILSEVTGDNKAFIEARDMFFLLTVDHHGRPTVSYKGGAPGFVKVIDPKTIVFPSFDGNGMFLSMGNIAGHAQIGMLFIDFEHPLRLRLQGVASVHTDDPLLAEYKEADLIVRVTVSDVWINCPRYVHRHTKVAPSRYVPRDACETPLAEWKRIDLVQDVLPPKDHGRPEHAGGSSRWENGSRKSK